MLKSLDAFGHMLSKRPILLVLGLEQYLLALFTLSRNGFRTPDDHYPFGWDFFTFSCAARALHIDASALYDPKRLLPFCPVSGTAEPLPFLNPPFFAALFAPLQKLPFALAVAIWLSAQLVLVWIAKRRLVQGSDRFFLLACAAPPVCTAFMAENSTFLSVALLGLGYAAIEREEMLAAGALFGLLAYRPQLLVFAAALAVMMRVRQWRFWVALAAVPTVLVAYSALAQGDTLAQYVAFSRSVLPTLVHSMGHRPAVYFTIATFFEMLVPALAPIATTLGVIVGAALLLAFWFASWRLRLPRALVFAIGSMLVVLVTPHSPRYEWTLLGLSFLLLDRELVQFRARWIALAVILMAVALISPFVAEWQMTLLGWAIHPAAPTLAAALVVVLMTVRSALDDHGSARSGAADPASSR